MKLFEALLKRKESLEESRRCKNRIVESAKYQEGLEPNEDIPPLIKRMDECLDEYLRLLIAINKTNNAIIDNETGKSLMELIAEKDVLNLTLKQYEEIAKESIISHRYTVSEVKFLPAIKYDEVMNTVEKLIKRIKSLDCKIQKMNWANSLLIE